MLSKNNFFKNFTFNSQKFYQNLSKTKKVYKVFESDLKNFDIPLLESFEKKALLSVINCLIFQLSLISANHKPKYNMRTASLFVL